MEEKKNTAVASGYADFCSLLTIAFIVLKLCGIISWSWIWVLAPLWFGAVLALAIYLTSLIIVTIALL